MYKMCPRCETSKKASEFNKNRRNPDGLQGYCRLCQRAHFKRYGKENRERLTRNRREWGRANGWASDRKRLEVDPWYNRLKVGASRARKAGSEVEAVKSEDLLAYWEAVGISRSECFHCSIELSDDYDLDHLIPLSAKGPHSVTNIVPSCPKCNRGRTSRKERRALLLLADT